MIDCQLPDWRYQVSQALTTFVSNLFQRSPERLFEADAGLLAINGNRMFDDRR
jgi:hypothetical protein